MQNLGTGARRMCPEQTFEPPRERWIQDDDVGRDVGGHAQTAFRAVGNVDHAAVTPQTCSDVLGKRTRGARDDNQQHGPGRQVAVAGGLLRQRAQDVRTRPVKLLCEQTAEQP